MTEECCECSGRGYTTEILERPPFVATERVECEWCDGTGEVDDGDDRQGSEGS
jgi:DnaJ-class molecular chaperone